MNIGLVGWGVETQSAYRYFGTANNYLICSEEPLHSAPLPDNVTVQSLSDARPPGLTGNVSDLSYLGGVDECDLIVVSPTAKKVLESVYPPGHAIWPKVTSSMQIFFEKCQNKQIIGVTGTKGKGTTASLIAAMLKKAGKTVHLAGNIGEPVLDLLSIMEPDDWIVLELSSFQLYRFPYSPHIAVHLMMVPEHIAEWHETIEDYVSAKRNIFAHQQADDIAIYYPENANSNDNVSASVGVHIPYTQEPGAFVVDRRISIGSEHIIGTHDIEIKGAHNLQNICAAITTVWQIAQDSAAIRSTIKSFTGLEHRLQTIAIKKDVIFVDDSFGTTPDTALVAMDAYTEPKVMIVGGHDKGSDYSPLVKRLKQNDISHIICIGPVGNWVAQQLEQSGMHDKTTHRQEPNDWTMPEIVSLAQSVAKPGDVVLLSCGSSSFGIFSDYKDRGNQFISAVRSL